VVGEPLDDLEVDDFEWDEVNIAHLLERHSTDFNDINEVLDSRPQYFTNLAERAGSHVMIGPNYAGRFFFAAIVRTSRVGIWRVITAWSLSRRDALKLYEEGRNDD
jgi:uncharacterized DUF497 family protein